MKSLSRADIDPRTFQNQYLQAFEDERQREYLTVRAYERKCGFEVNRGRLEKAAQILACPLKVNPPNWQHGRILYSLVRFYLANTDVRHPKFLDIGTAKGFSALCMTWAIVDADKYANVTSLDVIDPEAVCFRNSIIEVDGPKKLSDYLQQWPEAERIEFVCARGVDWLGSFKKRVHFAFIDGKHRYLDVKTEIELLTVYQQTGDVIVLDDVQIDGVAQAVLDGLDKKLYVIELLEAKADRKYVIAVRR